jgi:hypothetical protein
MRSRLILQQHMAHAQMINKALKFCESMLTRSDLLYPFALLCEQNHTTCIFTPHSSQLAPPQMIESLQTQIERYQKLSNNQQSVSLLVYCATVSQPKSPDCDVLVMLVSDSQKQNTIAIYPYQQSSNGIKISQPYTCDFSD